MICRTCNTSNFVTIDKMLSQKDTKKDSKISLIICRTCDPVTASLNNICNGYEVGIKTLGLKFDTKMNKILKSYSKFNIDFETLSFKESKDSIECKGRFLNKEQLEIYIRKF